MFVKGLAMFWNRFLFEITESYFCDGYFFIILLRLADNLLVN